MLRFPELLGVTFALSRSSGASDLLHAEALAVSDPRSPRYGQHLTLDEITRITASPHLEAVISWLTRKNASEIAPVVNKDAVFFTMKPEEIERLFKVNLAHWVNSVSGRVVFRSAIHPAVPAELSEAIDLVMGLSSFPPSQLHRQVKTSLGRHRAAALRQKHQESTTAPTLTLAASRGGDGTMDLLVRPRCLDGSFASSVPICGSDSVSFLISWNNNPQSDVTVTGNDVRCAPDAGSSIVECTMSNVPVPLYKPMDDLTIVTEFSGKKSDPFTSQFPVVSTPAVTPSTLREYYGIEPDRHVVSPGVSQSVAEFEEQYYSPADLRAFFEAVGLNPLLANNVPLIGPNIESDPGVEAALDIEYIMALAAGAPTTFWSIKANSTLEIDDILRWAMEVMNTEDVPQVHSLSYGMAEKEVDKFLGPGYLDRFYAEIPKLAARGLTVIIASGDTGAGDLGDPPMSEPTCNERLHPDWPSSSPYVTAVGSTYLTPFSKPICYSGDVDCSNQPLGEVVVSLDNGLFWTSGSGFSDHQSRPQFQEHLVSEYLKNNKDVLPPASMFNSSNRAYPDVVTVGHNYMITWNGTIMAVDGTSSSAPTFGGITTLLNDALHRAGFETQVGWLNPLLYLAGEISPLAFRAVTVGNNKCGAYPRQANSSVELCCPHGYQAVSGTYSAVSGLGSPRYEKLEEIVIAANQGKFIERESQLNEQ